MVRIWQSSTKKSEANRVLDKILEEIPVCAIEFAKVCKRNFVFLQVGLVRRRPQCVCR